MLVHPQIDPVALQIGPLAIHWYGLMYLFAFAQFLLLGRLRVRQEPYHSMRWTFKDVEDILFWGVVGVIVGGRLGYVFFYMPSFYLQNPIAIFKLGEGVRAICHGRWCFRWQTKWLAILHSCISLLAKAFS